MILDKTDPKKSLEDIHKQQAILKASMDTQVCLQLMLKHGIITEEEIAEMRRKVANLNTYKSTLDQLSYEEDIMQKAIAHPDAYNKELLKAMLDEKLRGK